MAVFQKNKTLEWQSQVHSPSRPTLRVLSIVILNAAYILSLQMAWHSSLLKRLSHSRFIESCILRGLSINVSADISVNCRSTYRSLCRSRVGRYNGRVVFACRSRSTDSRSWYHRYCVGNVSGNRRLSIGKVSVDNQHRLESVESLLLFGKMTQHSSSILGHEAAGQNWFRFILFRPLKLQSWNDLFLCRRLSFDVLFSLCLATGTYSTTSAMGSFCAVKRLLIG